MEGQGGGGRGGKECGIDRGLGLTKETSKYLAVVWAWFGVVYF